MSVPENPKDAVIRKQVQSVQFDFYTDEQVRRRSVVEITSPVSLDVTTGLALPGGLYDPLLGPSSRFEQAPCRTCARRYDHCPGHGGHMELAVPVYHPLLLSQIVPVLRAKCWHCHKFQSSKHVVDVYVAKFQLLHTNQIDELSSLDDRIAAAMAHARQQLDLAVGTAARQAANSAMNDILSPLLAAAAVETTEEDTGRSRHWRTLHRELCKTAVTTFRSEKRCQNCGAFSPRIRLNDHSKIFQARLSKNHTRLNATEGIVLQSALAPVSDNNNTENRSQRMPVDEEGENNDDADDEDDETNNPIGDEDKYVPTVEVRAQLQRLYEREPFLCYSILGNLEKYFMQVVPVPPSRFRPPMMLETMSVEHAQTAHLSQILVKNAIVRDRIAASSANENNSSTKSSGGGGDVYAAWIDLQTAVNVFMDGSKDPNAGAASANVVNGIRQILERKEGLFRKNMMGKRVDFACRSVISPDPYIGTNEIGLPAYFASVLTYPTPVTPRNVAEMRVLVERGPSSVGDGARWVEKDHRRIDLSKMNAHQRRAVAAQLLLRSGGGGGIDQYNNKYDSNHTGTIVGRQLRDGDYVLMNRQPTLHKPGIMAHRVRILHDPTQKTIRMHYANCNTYNADFDGDEMNCHFPQNDLARAEAQYIAQTDLQYIVPTDGSPLRGLIQDHVVGGVKLTKKDTFLEKWEYQQLLFAALTSLSGLELIRSTDRIELVPPAIIKPRPLWTGKQVISTLLLHLRKGNDRDDDRTSNFPGISTERKAKTSDSAFGTEQEEHLVLIKDGELLRGVLDKAAFGPTDFSLVHAVYEAYGPGKAGLLLNSLGRLFTAYIQFYAGHSCRMEDLVLTKEADLERRKLVQGAYNLGSRAAKAWADSEGGKISIAPLNDHAEGDKPLKPVEAAATSVKIGKLLAGKEGRDNFAALDGYMQGQLNPLSSKIVKVCLPSGLAVPFPYNSFSIMTTTGAKGSLVNQSQITCALGQQALEGRRVPRMSSGRTLPSFAPYDPNPRADGFVMDRFLTGIRPQEYYFHCMAGREGLVDTAVKTSRSGYLQRCLVKHLEELKICYDHTVRNAEGDVIQFLYGEDGLDPIACSYLDCSARSFDFIARNVEALERRNKALPSSTIELAYSDATRYIEVKEDDSKPLEVGELVLARRLRTGLDWVRGSICLGWNIATVRKVHKGGKIVDLVYHEDQHKENRVPISIELDGSGGTLTRALSSKAILVKRCVPDPILSSLRGGHRLGSSGACLSERVATAAATIFSHDKKLQNIFASGKLTKKRLSSLVAAKYSSSLCAPGEAVGCIAAQSIGEPSTQMTLNTFHLAGAGANVTLGIPRLREIIMTASREVKTPTMSVPLKPSVTEKEAIRLAREFTKLSLMDLIACHRGITVTERLEKSDSGGWLRSYYVTLKFHPSERIREAFGLSLHDIAKVVAKNFVPLLSQTMKKELKRASVEGDGNFDEIVGGAPSEYVAASLEDEGHDGQENQINDDDMNEDDPDDDENDLGEEDGVEYARKDNASHNSELDNDSELDGDESDAREFQSTGPPIFSPAHDPSEESLNEGSTPTISKKKNSISLQALKVDPRARPILMVGLVEKAAAAIYVKSRKNINQAFVNDEVGRGRCLQTAGVNFQELWKLDVIDHSQLQSNDIWAIRCAYGVEAARANIMKQIVSVFGAYGIEVDPRHLSLIADFMTFDGGFRPMSRTGMENSSSTFLQMSFETTTHFLINSALTCAKDDIISPSANIVVGRPVKHGTGSFTLLAKS